MSEDLHAAIRALVSARLSARGRGSNAEDVEAMANEAIAIAEQIEVFRMSLRPENAPSPLALVLRASRPE